MQDYLAMLLKGVCTLALLQGSWALTSPLKRLRRATTVAKSANVGLASLKPADLKIAGSAACGVAPLSAEALRAARGRR